MELFLFLIILLFITILTTYRFFFVKEKLAFFTLLIISAFSFFCIKLFTVEPDVISGNGNPAILIMPIAVLAYFSLLYVVTKLGSKMIKKWNKKKLINLSILNGLLLIVLIIGAANEINQLVAALGGGPDVPDSRIFRYGWFNQYTNTMYFNAYTFVLGICICLFFTIFKEIYIKCQKPIK